MEKNRENREKDREIGKKSKKFFTFLCNFKLFISPFSMNQAHIYWSQGILIFFLTVGLVIASSFPIPE